LISPGSNPPVDLNKFMLEYYRPVLRKFYLINKADFK
jgi:hypothetical protein